MLPAAGCLLLLAGLLGMLLSAHFKALRFFDRPAPARWRHFDRVLDALKWILAVSGLALLTRASPAAGMLTGGALASLWGYRLIVRSPGFQARLLRREFDALRRRRPELATEQALYELAWRRHPRWGPELIEQMVKDHPTIESFAAMVARMERGFRGFRTRLRRR